MHTYPSMQKSGAIIGSMKQGIAEINKVSPISARIIECALPYAIQEATELNTAITSIIPELNAQTITQKVLQMAPKDHLLHQQNPHQIEEMVEGFISSSRTSQIKRKGKIQTNPHKEKGNNENLLGSIKNLISPMAVTTNGLLMRVPEIDQKEKIMTKLTILEGLTGDITREKILTLMSAIVATAVLGYVSVYSSAIGAGSGQINNGSLLAALAMNPVEYLGLSSLLTPVKESVIRSMRNDIDQISGIKFSSNHLRTIIQLIKLALIVGTYAYDLVTTWEGLPNMGIKDARAVTLLTPLATFGLEFAAAKMVGAISDIKEEMFPNGILAGLRST